MQSFVYYWDAPYQRALDDCFDTIICLLLGCSLSTSFGRLFWCNHLFITGMLLSTSFGRLFWYNHLFITGMLLINELWTIVLMQSLFITGMLLINELWTIVLMQSFVYYWDAPYQRALDDCFDTSFVYYWDAPYQRALTIVLIQSFVYYWDAPYQRALDDCFDTIICLLLGCSLSTSFGRLFWCNHLFITGMLLINELWTIVLIQSFVYYWDAPYQRALDDCFDAIICLLLGCSLSTSFRRLFWCNHLFITGMLLINELWTIVLIQSFVYYWDAPYQRALDDCFDTIICLLLGCSLSTSFGRLFWSIICLLLGCSLSTSFGWLFWCNHLFITGMLLINEL